MSKSRNFADQSYIDDYLNNGYYPDIHNPVILMAKRYANEPEACLDLGSNTGLLSVAMIENVGRSYCVSIEANDSYLQKGMKVYQTYPDKIQMYHLPVTTDSIIRLSELIKKFKVTLIIARRVFPEIDDMTNGIVPELAKMFHEAGVQKIILEGRVPVKNAALNLYKAELEIDQLIDYYKPTKNYKNVYLLERKS